MCPCEGHRTTYGNWFSLSNMWVPGTELRSSALAASAFTSLAIFPAQIFFSTLNHRDLEFCMFQGPEWFAPGAPQSLL